ncbi:hypothetical protein D7030_00015 [Flavobacteriaceae bacterium AU392]|nr:hypothetical protein D1817_14420 [Flavobacteriaceae bacterium]RKM86918.1 hypothetical protein D7030_00015 [Flavobacteriaceae bacterium AU392]
MVFLAYACSTDDETFDNQTINEIENLNQEFPNEDNLIIINASDTISSSNPLNLNITNNSIPEHENSFPGGEDIGDVPDNGGNESDSDNGGDSSNTICSSAGIPTATVEDLELGIVLAITYSSSLSIGEINCVRQEYFQDPELLCLSLKRPPFPANDPYHDTWVITGEGCDSGPGGGSAGGGSTGGVSSSTPVTNKTQNDPRVSISVN